MRHKFNWGLKNCPITTEWIWRIDADEFLEGNLGPAMKKALAECNNEVNGVYVRKRIDFMGKPLLHGGWYPSYHLKYGEEDMGSVRTDGWMNISASSVEQQSQWKRGIKWTPI